MVLIMVLYTTSALDTYETNRFYILIDIDDSICNNCFMHYFTNYKHPDFAYI